MNQKQEAIKYLNNLKNNSYIVLSILIILVFATLLLMGFLPLLFFLNPLAIVATGVHSYVMVKRFQFIKKIYRILGADLNDVNIKNQIEELFTNLTTDIEDTVVKIKMVKPLYLGERAYNRAGSNTFIEKNVDYKIIKRIHEIYNKK